MHKKLKPYLTRSKRLSLPMTHPLVVIADLNNGSLESLSQYIALHGNIPDKEISSELLKLLNGGPEDSRYRLAVIDHPDLPTNRGGRPRSNKITASSIDIAISQAYDELRARRKSNGGAYKQSALVEDLSKKFDISKFEVREARARVAKYATEELKRIKLVNRKEQALEKLRKGLEDNKS